MAIGARSVSRTDWSIAVTGVAGPTGGSAEKPVGTVWLAWAGPQGVLQAEHHFFAHGNRQHIRLNSVQVALRQLLQFLQ
jgi:nicotinamide-nucleotide amidase